jgi:hypothetical protein
VPTRGRQGKPKGERCGESGGGEKVRKAEKAEETAG